MPSRRPATRIYLSLYPAQFAGIVMLAGGETRLERATLIDSLILTVGLGVISGSC